jgi:hypothetical protein
MTVESMFSHAEESIERPTAEMTLKNMTIDCDSRLGPFWVTVKVRLSFQHWIDILLTIFSQFHRVAVVWMHHSLSNGHTG